MDKALESRAVRTGYLTLTVPALATVVLAPLLGVRIFDTSLLLYYALAWMALAWQWYDIALPGWEELACGKGRPFRRGRKPCRALSFRVASEVRGRSVRVPHNGCDCVRHPLGPIIA